MPVAMHAAYLEHLPGLQAEVFALLLDATSFPHLSEAGRAAVLRRWQTIVDDDDLAHADRFLAPAQLAMIGIGYAHG